VHRCAHCLHDLGRNRVEANHSRQWITECLTKLDMIEPEDRVQLNRRRECVLSTKGWRDGGKVERGGRSGDQAERGSPWPSLYMSSANRDKRLLGLWRRFVTTAQESLRNFCARMETFARTDLYSTLIDSASKCGRLALSGTGSGTRTSIGPVTWSCDKWQNKGNFCLSEGVNVSDPRSDCQCPPGEIQGCVIRVGRKSESKTIPNIGNSGR
jgi:hypothetical protein